MPNLQLEETRTVPKIMVQHFLLPFLVYSHRLSIPKCMDQRHLSCSDHSHQVETPPTTRRRLVVFLTHWRKCFLRCRRVVPHRNVQTHGHRLPAKRCQFCSTSMDHEEKNTGSNTTVAEARHATEFLKSNSRMQWMCPVIVV